MLYGIVQNGVLLVGNFYGVVYFGCAVCHGDFFRALRERYYRLDTKSLTSPFRTVFLKAKPALRLLDCCRLSERPRKVSPKANIFLPKAS